MNCKRIEAILVGFKEYKSRLFQKKYKAYYYRNKRYETSNERKIHFINIKRKNYGVCYCVSYRPIGTKEWLLQRGWWNDKGIWTADGIFNDGII